ncbi:MAG: hypothetical protein IRZ24_01265 [Thermogemmatispora sp.]|uniref:hypothetical protein n=1 Tax=Thermogemmatispora sp. TaxID=1968838 RepID=UPI001E15305E|nr:hypothetical protein [Thermogemmatispora sp.]MBX5448671.1 hypothetical protein [Thermogemmatispora sp.]
MKEKFTGPERSGVQRVEELLRPPRMVVLAVLFDWSLLVQLLTMPLLARWLRQPPALSLPWLSPALNTLLSLLSALPFALLLALCGEGMRRGLVWARHVQVALNTLLALAGLAGVYTLWLDARRGNYWPLVTLVTLVGLSPLIIWGLHQPAARQWFNPPPELALRIRQRRASVPPSWSLLLATLGLGLLEALAGLLR